MSLIVRQAFQPFVEAVINSTGSGFRVSAGQTRKSVLRPSQTSIFDAMGLIRIYAEAAFFIFLVFAEIPVEIFDVAVAFEREYVGRDAIKEPAVVGYYDGASGKVFEGLFERTHRVHIEVVRGLVEEDHVSPGF